MGAVGVFTGVVAKHPETVSRSGKSSYVAISCRDDSGQYPEFCQITAYGKAGEAALSLRVGSMIQASGKFTAGVYTKKDGSEGCILRLFPYAISELSAKLSQSPKPRTEQSTLPAAPQPKVESPPPNNDDDDVPF